MMPVVRKHRGEKPRHIGHVSGHHDDSHGLSDGTAYAQHHRRRHAAAGGRHHPEVGLRLRGAQCQTGLLILPRHGLKGRLRHVDDGGSTITVSTRMAASRQAPEPRPKARRMAGTSTIMPTRPYTTDGMPASSCTAVRITAARRGGAAFGQKRWQSSDPPALPAAALPPCRRQR